MGKLALGTVVHVMPINLLVLIIVGYVGAVSSRWIITAHGSITVLVMVTILTSSGLSCLSA